MNMSGPTYLMLHARIVPSLSSDYANASESYNSFPDAEADVYAEAFLSSASAEKNWIDPYVPDQYTATVLTPFPGLSDFL